MAKGPKLPKNNSEEEYKFSDIENEQPPEPEEPKRRSLKTLLLNRRILMIIGIIIAVFVVYLFMGKKPEVEQEIAQVDQPKTLSEQPLQPLPAPSIQATAPTTPPPEVNGTQQQLQTVSQQAQQNQTQIQQLQGNIAQLQNSVNQLGTKISGVTSNVCTLTQACAPPSPPPVVKPVVIKAVPKKVAPPPFYTVRAVVPGRAWLQVKKNEHIVHLITVRVGDFLPGYGRVQAINSRQGKVWTSWGTVIKYGSNDS